VERANITVMESMSIFFELKNVSVLFIIPPPPSNAVYVILAFLVLLGMNYPEMALR
jgi:hypothetical protein